MGAKTSSILLSAALTLAVNGTVSASDTDSQLRRHALNVIGFAIEPTDDVTDTIPTSSGSTAGRYLGATSATSASCLLGGADPTEPDHGLAVACNYWDFQKNGTMGRQVAADKAFGPISFAWTNQQNTSADQGRNNRMEGVSGGALGDGTGGIDIAGPATDPNERSGFVAMAPVADGTAIFAEHWSRVYQTDQNSYSTYVFKLENWAFGETVGFGGVSGTGRIHDSIWNVFNTDSEQRWYWPQVALTESGATFAGHILMHSNLGDERFIYTRRVGFVGEWEPAIFIGYNPELSPTVVASPNSERVAIIWSGYRGDGTANNCSVDRRAESGAFMDTDMYYMISEDAGATWSPCVNITQFPDSAAGTYRPYSHLDALFDANDDLNIAWTALRYRGWGQGAERASRIYHWNEATQTTRTAADGAWIVENCNGGDFQGNIDQPQLSECAGKLYLTFNMFAPVPLGRGDDCSERALAPTYAGEGAANGEMFVTVSDNSGFTWDPPRNMTESYTPDCDTLPDGSKVDCHSNNWHSTTRYGIDVTIDNYTNIPDFTNRIDPAYVTETGDYLFSFYVDDYDPGGAIRGNGGWTENTMRLFRFGCVDKVSAARVASSLPQGLVTSDSVLNGSPDTTLNWILENIGDLDVTDLNITVTASNPAGFAIVTGFGSALNSGAANADSGGVQLALSLLSPGDTGTATIVASGSFAESPMTFDYLLFTQEPCCQVAGDANRDGAVTIGDVTCMITGIFLDGLCSPPFSPCPEVLDADNSGSFNIGDVIHLIAYIFTAGSAPECGSISLTEDEE